MTLLHHILLAQATTPPAKSTSSGSSLSTILLLPLIVIAGYILFIRPRRAKMKQQVAQAAQLEVGASVMSVGGIMGTIVGVSDKTFDVEVADGVTMTFLKRAINSRPVSAGGTDAPVSDDELPRDPFEGEQVPNEHDVQALDDSLGDRAPGDDDDPAEHRPDDEPGAGPGGLGSGGR